MQPAQGETLAPADDANTELVSRVHQPARRNPKPAGKYDLVVLGGGTAGLVSAMGAAGLGARIVLVERQSARRRLPEYRLRTVQSCSSLGPRRR